MKIFTRISMIALISLFCTQSNAQSFGLKAGFNLAKIVEKNDFETNRDFENNQGFHAGFTIGVPITEHASFEPGLLLTTKGFKITLDDENLGVPVTSRYNLYYLQVPLAFKISQNISEEVKIFWDAGPYVGAGITGKAKATAEYQGLEISDEKKIDWGLDEDNDDFLRPEMGLTFGTGLEIYSFTLEVSYDLGVSNISPYHDNGYRINNRVLKFSAGYRFSK